MAAVAGETVDMAVARVEEVTREAEAALQVVAMLATGAETRAQKRIWRRRMVTKAIRPVQTPRESLGQGSFAPTSASEGRKAMHCLQHPDGPRPDAECAPET